MVDKLNYRNQYQYQDPMLVPVIPRWDEWKKIRNGGKINN